MRVMMQSETLRYIHQNRFSFASQLRLLVFWLPASACLGKIGIFRLNILLCVCVCVCVYLRDFLCSTTYLLLSSCWLGRVLFVGFSRVPAQNAVFPQLFLCSYVPMFLCSYVCPKPVLVERVIVFTYIYIYTGRNAAQKREVAFFAPIATALALRSSNRQKRTLLLCEPCAKPTCRTVLSFKFILGSSRACLGKYSVVF
jgi:hypothetical protein